MSNTFKITCPSCKKEFDADSAFNLHFEKAKKDAAKNAEMDAAKKYKSQIESAAKEIEKLKKMLQKMQKWMLQKNINLK